MSNYSIIRIIAECNLNADDTLDYDEFLSTLKTNSFFTEHKVVNEQEVKNSENHLYTLSIHNGTVVSMIKPLINSDLIISLSVDKNVILWSTSKGEYKDIICLDAAPTKLFLFTNKQKVLIPKWDNSFDILDNESLLTKDIKTENVKGHSCWILHAIELINGRQYSTCSRDHTIKIWNFEGNNCEMTLTGHTSYVNYIIEMRENIIISSSSDHTIQVWDISKQTDNKGLTIKDGEESVFQIEKISEDYICSRAENNILNIWDINNGNLVKKFQKHPINIICLLILKNGKIATGSYDRTVKIFDYNKDEEDATLTGHNFTVYCLAELGNGNIVTGSGDCTIKIWDCNNYQCLSTFEGHSKYVVSLLVIDDEKIASGSYDSRIKIWKINKE